MSRLKELGMDSCAITDHGNMYGAIEFYKAAKANGVKPIIGCEVYICTDMSIKSFYTDPESVGKRILKTENKEKDNDTCHLTLLAMNNEGYQNLLKLVSAANLSGFYYKPRIDFKLLQEHSAGLICLSGCLGGQLSQLILKDKGNEAVELALAYKKLFGDRYYIEIQRHPRNKDQSYVTPKLIELAESVGIDMVATGDSHYMCEEDGHVHDVLLAVNTGTKLDDKNRFSLADNDVFVTSPTQMAEKFADLPEALSNTQIIAERCNVDIELGKIKLPSFEIEGGDTPDEYLRLLSRDGLRDKELFDSKEYYDRLQYELDIIAKTGFATYLLIVWDMIKWAKDNNIAVGPGRGSAAGSLICYCLGITNVDPIKYGLLFERFMNPERISMPDIDMDFEDTKRSLVIEYVTKKYGQDHVAQIVTFGTMYAKSSIRDAGRAMGYDLKTCDHISKMIPFNQSLSDALESVSDLRKEYQIPESRKLIDMAMRLEGVVRNAGTHACGIVISDKPITEYMPVQMSKEGLVTSQYDMNIVGELGLLKMDFLGLRNLSVISECQRLIKKHLGVDVDANNIPLDDRRTFKLLQDAKTTSVFQLESGGMKRYLKDLKPTDINDITAMVSLFRPGPMELIPEYIDRKHGRKEITYLHPSLEPVLKETYGIMIYQEQLIKAVQVLAGFSLAQADVLRKAVGKKIKKLLDEQEDGFKSGCKKMGVPDKIANTFWALVEPFNRYGFNKSHAMCYAMIAYQTAYLKANYPLQFMLAEINSNDQIDRITELVSELKDIGIKVSPPNINRSEERFTGVDGAVVFSLSSIKGMNSKIIDNILSVRSEAGEFKSLDDFVMRLKKNSVNKKVIELLAKSGSMDDWGERIELFNAAEQISVYAQEDYKRLLPPLVIPKTQNTLMGQKLSWEKELLGLYVSSNPAKNYSQKISGKGITEILKIQDAPIGNIKVGGVITDFKKKITKTGKTLYILNLTDLSGSMEVAIFNGVFNKNKEVFAQNNVVILSGAVEYGNEGKKFVCLGGRLVDKF